MEGSVFFAGGVLVIIALREFVLQRPTNDILQLAFEVCLYNPPVIIDLACCTPGGFSGCAENARNAYLREEVTQLPLQVAERTNAATPGETNL